MRYNSVAALLLVVSSGQASAEDKAVITITTTTTRTNSSMIFAQMDNIGTDFVRRYGLGGPPTDVTGTAADVAREISKNNKKGFADALATGLGLIASDAVMRRTVEQIEREQAARK